MTSFEYIRERCGNKEWGGRIIYHNYKLCFQPLKFEQADDGRWYYSDHIEEADLKIVARGIVPHYIRYEHEKDLKELFADYYNGCLDTFKNNRRNDIELMLKSEKEIEIVFVETMIDEESWRIEYSEKGLKPYSEYFTDKENEILKQVGIGFIGYLQDRLKDLKPEQEQQDTPTASPSAKDDGNSYITNDKILKALPDLYDCLVDDGAVSKDYIKKEDFSTCITKANIPQLKQGKSEWIKKTTKFKGFIKCIRHCFNDDWYSAICKSADLTDKDMGKYNTDKTADFEVTLKAKLKQNGIG